MIHASMLLPYEYYLLDFTNPAILIRLSRSFSGNLCIASSQVTCCLRQKFQSLSAAIVNECSQFRLVQDS